MSDPLFRVVSNNIAPNFIINKVLLAEYHLMIKNIYLLNNSVLREY